MVEHQACRDSMWWRYDKYDNEVSADVSVAMQRLSDSTNCARVLAHDGEVGRIGYWSKTASIGMHVFTVLRQEGFKVTSATCREIERFDDVKTVGYLEAIPMEAGR